MYKIYVRKQIVSISKKYKISKIKIKIDEEKSIQVNFALSRNECHALKLNKKEIPLNDS